MNTLAEEFYRYGGGDPIESTPIHLAYDVVLWLFQDFSSMIEYKEKYKIIIAENIWPEKYVAVDESAPRTTYSWR
jgi:hypothetical protein